MKSTHYGSVSCGAMCSAGGDKRLCRNCYFVGKVQSEWVKCRLNCSQVTAAFVWARKTFSILSQSKHHTCRLQKAITALLTLCSDQQRASFGLMDCSGQQNRIDHWQIWADDRVTASSCGQTRRLTSQGVKLCCWPATNANNSIDTQHC